MKKAFMALLVGLICIPAITYAEDDKFATISDISKEDSVDVSGGLDVNITQTDPKNVLVEYGKNKEIKLKKVDDSADGRPDNKAWLGIKFDVSSIGSVADAKYTVNGGAAQNIDEDDLDFYFPVTEDEIKSAIDDGKEYIEYIVKLDWDNNSTYEQTVTVRIYVQKLEIAPKDGDSSSKTWTAEDTQNYIEEVQASQDDQTPSDNNSANSNLDDVPKTGDTLPIALIGAVALALGIGAYNIKLAYSRR